MKRLIVRWIILAVSVAVAAWLTGLVVPGFAVKVETVGDAARLMLGVAALSLLNATLGKVLKLLALPLNCLTLGAFSLVINAAMLMLAGSLNMGFTVDNFWAALLGSVLLSAINGVLGAFVPDDEKKD